MKKVIGLLLVFAVFWAGCKGREANPAGVELPRDESQSSTAVEATVGDVNYQQQVSQQVAGPREPVIEIPVLDVSNQEVSEEIEEIREPDVVFVPTPQDVVEKMLELVKVTKDDLVYDLGCGDGRIVVTAAKNYGCKAVGYDIDPERIKESLENVEKNNVGNLVRIEQKDIFTLDLSKANVITLYLLPELNVRLIPQLEKLKPGSRIVSHDFRMKGVKPDEVIKVTSIEDNREHKVYLWTAPLKKKEKELAPVEDDSVEGF
ncbi:MAG: cyclopropane-fatty-acyl-phospholipid synthase family protein [Phycisphaerae bacterium]